MREGCGFVFARLEYPHLKHSPPIISLNLPVDPTGCRIIPFLYHPSADEEAAQGCMRGLSKATSWEIEGFSFTLSPKSLLFPLISALFS